MSTAVYFWTLSLLLLFCISGSVLDITFILNVGTKANKERSLLCITGERDAQNVQLNITRDNTIIRMAQPPKCTILRSNKTNTICVLEDNKLNIPSISYCIGKSPMEETLVTMISNNFQASLSPVEASKTVNHLETVDLLAKVMKDRAADVLWKVNGTYTYTTHKLDIMNGFANLTISKADVTQTGVYSATFIDGSPIESAFFRLIVRACKDKKWGVACDKDCPNCVNGGVCHDRTGECICPPGFMGMRCEKACREGMFGRNCQEQCLPDRSCSGLKFCLPDPYGCSCATGWHGPQCNKACRPNSYGPNCKLTCKCQNDGECNRFSGCICQVGWHGQFCEKSDQIPQVYNLLSEVELNINTSPVLTCSANGKPPPVHGNIELQKPDRSNIVATKTIMDANQTTAEFKLQKVTMADKGFWECRVSTSGGQDSQRFKVIVKVPPTPHNPPILVQKMSNQLTIMAAETYNGDGPIKQFKLQYKAKDTDQLWSSITADMQPITLKNLIPMTSYIIQAQLERPGEGGKGPFGPTAILETECLGPSSPRELQAETLSINAIRVKWLPPLDPNGGIRKYTIECQRVGTNSEQQWIDTVNGNETTMNITSLNSSTEYQFRVRAVASVSGQWSLPVQASTQGKDNENYLPTPRSSYNPYSGSSGSKQLLLAIVGSVSATCITILIALAALLCIRRRMLKPFRSFTYQSGLGEETILQFNSGTLTLTRQPKHQPEPLRYPVLEWDDIKFEDVIGEGNFGQVIKAMIKKDGLRISAAVKKLKEFASENDHRDFAGELEVLCKLGHHPNIINLLGACENKGYLYIAIEYAPYGNLLDFLRKSRVLETDPAFAKEHGTASTLTSQQLLQFVVDVAKGMQYLSEKQFIHRDLAARNVLVGENLVAKIADFGLSRGEEVYVKKTMGRLPVRWMAIESLNYSVYTTKSDVWSFGVLLWEIVSLGGTPYCGMTCAQLYEKLPHGYRMEKPPNCDDEVYDLMRQCWRDRPHERPTFAQICVQLSRMLEARKAYVNVALFENFTYAGIDATAEEA
ncbi:tyrosine-protein kinase receptor Tie-1 isoform X2 [Protopterus annectens]|uniref:tyrosine-protein kinase receptor Tie-1 isoform X2 n=1 Tax=Protopterus annectens TaxID=7888 RepID=UPI001CFA6174|nr:tyrosine-protein kinase receptor Tie-1 isoform X2 [Protopterus annectens]